MSARAQLEALRGKLAAIAPVDADTWPRVDAWVASATPVIRKHFPDHFEDFRSVSAMPSWTYLPRVMSQGDPYDQGFGPSRGRSAPRDNFAEADAAEQKSNLRKAEEARQKILAFVDGLIRVSDDGLAADDNGRVEPVADNKKVFVIHGRNERAVAETGIFLRSMGLEPVWFRDVRKEMGGTAFIAKVVERGMEQAQGVLALFTPDEHATLRHELRRGEESGEAVARWQARPNVQFEAGMAYGRDPNRVAFVLFGDVKLFTDASGIHVFSPTNEHVPDSHRAMLRGLLAGGMKCAVNLHSDDWMTAGNFDAVVAGLVGVSPKDPFPPEPAAATAAGSAVTSAANLSPISMHDDEAKILLAAWLGRVGKLSQDHEADSPGLMSPVEIASNARVPESKVALLLTVAHENEHLGVTVKRLQGGKFHLEVGPPRVRQVRGDPWE